ncbi:hypothetical protein AB5I41_22925 [Sphingomonas sp. MMS24-JH45]
MERACAAAWPAAEVRELGGWVVACSGGGTRRANSASAQGPGEARCRDDRGDRCALCGSRPADDRAE